MQFQARISERMAAREDAALAFHFKMDEGGEMAYGENGDYDRRGWAADASGNNRAARLFNTDNDFVWNRGMMGNAFDADGVDDYAETVALNIGDGATDITLAAWINPDAKPANAAVISSTGTDYFSLLLSGSGTGNPVEFRAKSNGLIGPVNSGPIGKWTHAVGVWKSGQVHKLYLDGIEVANNATPPTGTVNVDQWIVGSDRLIASRYFNGC